ncbi:MAG TPA: hypothetical protein VD968_13310, partial [Pyrinomonadaceae bacterium]|nr:hypothetical protein [Pyrinomonadaceae bacterium]
MHLTVRPVVRSLSLFSFAFLLCLAFSSESVARAATINVAAGQTAVAADGQCSLREAIINANNDAQTHADCPSGSGADTITLPAGTYTTDQGFSDEDFSAEGDLDIRSNITINGAGAGTTIIEAASTPGAASDRVLHVVSGTVVLNDLTVRNGKAPDGADAQSDCTDSGCHDSNGAPGGSGGGILNAGTLTLNRVTMTANRAGKGGKAGDVSCVGSEEELHSTNCSTSGGKGGGGGAVYSSGALTVNSGTFTNNHSGEGGAAGLTSCSGGASCSSRLGNKGDGGALFGGTLNVTESTFSGNAAYDGGAIQQNDAPVNISNSSFAGNTAEWTGGAMNCNSGAITCDISGSTFSGNNATGGYGGALAFFNGG